MATDHPALKLAHELEADRFDMAEALNVIAHDYGLYAVKTRLDRLGFRAAPSRQRREGLDSPAADLYAEWEDGAADADPYMVPDWAHAILEAIADDSAVLKL